MNAYQVNNSIVNSIVSQLIKHTCGIKTINPVVASLYCSYLELASFHFQEFLEACAHGVVPIHPNYLSSNCHNKIHHHTNVNGVLYINPVHIVHLCHKLNKEYKCGHFHQFSFSKSFNYLSGEIPLDFNSFLTIRFIQAASDSSPSCICANSIIALNSGSNLNWNGGLPRLSVLCVDTLITPIVMWLCVITHYIQLLEKAMPRSASTLTGHLTTSDKQTIEVAMRDHITPLTGRNSHIQNIVFIWRFAECQQNKATYQLVIAHTENEARSMLPNLSLVFTARIRVGVTHA